MLAVAVTTPGEVRVVEVPEPAPGPYQAKVRTELSCLCNSTDTKLIKGHFPGIEDYPLLLGHETVGLVQSVGANVRSFKPGDRVVGGLLLESTAHTGAATVASRSTCWPATTRR